MRGVFISYRRDDTAGHAGRIFDRLVERLGRERVFMDVDGISPGEDFVDAIDRRIKGADVVFVLIGRRWLGDGAPPRIQDPGDFVRIEVAAALKLRLRVVPVLLDGAALPAASELPPELESLRRRNAVRVDGESFLDDVERLIGSVRPKRSFRLAAMAAASLAVLLTAGITIAAALPTQRAKCHRPDYRRDGDKALLFVIGDCTDKRDTARIDDWDFDATKLECGKGAFVSRVQEEKGLLAGVTCSIGEGSTQGCKAVPVSSREQPPRDYCEVDYGLFKAYCPPNQVVVGVSAPNETGVPRAVLCCPP